MNFSWSATTWFYRISNWRFYLKYQYRKFIWPFYGRLRNSDEMVPVAAPEFDKRLSWTGHCININNYIWSVIPTKFRRIVNFYSVPRFRIREWLWVRSDVTFPSYVVIVRFISDFSEAFSNSQAILATFQISIEILSATIVAVPYRLVGYFY